MRRPETTIMNEAGHICALGIFLITLMLPLAVFAAAPGHSPSEVRDVKLLPAPGGVRIVVSLSSAAEFTYNRLHDPERFYVDLKDARMEGSVGRDVRVKTGIVKAVRAGQFNRTTVRIVADLEGNGYRHTVNVYDDPPRIVVNISAPAPAAEGVQVRADSMDGAAGKAGVAQDKMLKASSADISGAAPKPLSFEAGLEAEKQGKWRKALEIYRALAKKEPQNADIWKRIGDLEWQLGDANGSAYALQRAADLNPRDAGLLSRLSQVYAELNQPENAFGPIRRAVELAPDNIEYLKALARIANWNGRPDIAAKSYRKILNLSPRDDASRLDLARSLSWSGDLDASVEVYRSYYAKHPGQKEVLIEYAGAEGWRGNYPAELKLLRKYRRDFGETKEYRKAMARLLARAERPTRALKLIDPLLEESPDDYDVNYSNTIALYHAHRLPESIRSLQTLESLRPESKETYDIRRFVTTAVRSNVEAGFQFYRDSDHLSLYRTRLKGTYFIDPDTRLQAGGEYDYLHADRGSGYETLDGRTSSEQTAGWIGAGRRLSPKLAVQGRIGAASVRDGSTTGVYDVSLDIQPADELLLRLERERGYYLVSPRTLSLGIKSSANRLNLTWQPDLVYTIDSSVSYVTLSDDNSFWEIDFGPRRAVIRRAKFNLDLGVSGSWLAYDKTLSNGYYSPTLEQRYAATAFGYWKINDDNGVSIVMSLGGQKDNTMNSFRLSYDASAEGTFGIYRDWMLKVNVGYAHNVRQASGAFDAFGGGLSVTRRF